MAQSPSQSSFRFELSQHGSSGLRHGRHFFSSFTPQQRCDEWSKEELKKEKEHEKELAELEKEGKEEDLSEETENARVKEVLDSAARGFAFLHPKPEMRPLPLQPPSPSTERYACPTAMPVEDGMASLQLTVVRVPVTDNDWKLSCMAMENEHARMLKTWEKSRHMLNTRTEEQVRDEFVHKRKRRERKKRRAEAKEKKEQEKKAAEEKAAAEKAAAENPDAPPVDAPPAAAAAAAAPADAESKEEEGKQTEEEEKKEQEAKEKLEKEKADAKKAEDEKAEAARLAEEAEIAKKTALLQKETRSPFGMIFGFVHSKHKIPSKMASDAEVEEFWKNGVGLNSLGQLVIGMAAGVPARDDPSEPDEPVEEVSDVSEIDEKDEVKEVKGELKAEKKPKKPAVVELLPLSERVDVASPNGHAVLRTVCHPLKPADSVQFKLDVQLGCLTVLVNSFTVAELDSKLLECDEGDPDSNLQPVLTTSRGYVIQSDLVEANSGVRYPLMVRNCISLECKQPLAAHALQMEDNVAPDWVVDDLKPPVEPEDDEKDAKQERKLGEIHRPRPHEAKNMLGNLFAQFAQPNAAGGEVNSDANRFKSGGAIMATGFNGLVLSHSRNAEVNNILSEYPLGAVESGALLQEFRYFEITILNPGVSCLISIGLAAAGYDPKAHAGWRADSYGYHGDDGKKFKMAGSAYARTWKRNDVVGCGYRPFKKNIFFTLNGHDLGNAFYFVPRKDWHAIVGMNGVHSVRVNFGQQAFTYKGVYKNKRYRVGPKPKIVLGPKPQIVPAGVPPAPPLPGIPMLLRQVSGERGRRPRRHSGPDRVKVKRARRPMPRHRLRQLLRAQEADRERKDSSDESDVAPDEDEKKVDEEIPVVKADSGPWTCAMCTFAGNEALWLQCSICHTARDKKPEPVPVAPPLPGSGEEKRPNRRTDSDSDWSSDDSDGPQDVSRNDEKNDDELVELLKQLQVSVSAGSTRVLQITRKRLVLTNPFPGNGGLGARHLNTYTLLMDVKVLPRGGDAKQAQSFCLFGGDIRHALTIRVPDASAFTVSQAFCKNNRGMELDRWYRIVFSMSFASKQLGLYVDGKDVEIKPTAGAWKLDDKPWALSPKFLIGGQKYALQSGPLLRVKTVRLWNSALRGDEIARLGTALGPLPMWKKLDARLPVNVDSGSLRIQEHKGWLYLLGGRNNQNIVYRINLKRAMADDEKERGTWYETLPRMDHSGYNRVLLIHKPTNTLYVVGSSNRSVFLSIELKDNSRDFSRSWTDLSHTQVGDSNFFRMQFMTGETIGNHLMLYGGNKSHRDNQDVWSYDVHKKSWNQVTLMGPLKPNAIYGCASCVYKKDLFLFGGSRYNNNHATNQVFKFDFNEDRSAGNWRNLYVPNVGAPTARRNCGGVRYGDKMYVFGGQGSGQHLDDLYAYDLKRNRWSGKLSFPSPPSKRSLHCIGIVDGMLVVAGGQGIGAPGNEIHVLDLKQQVADLDW